MDDKFKSAPCGEKRLAVLSVVLRRWFDKSTRVRSPTQGGHERPVEVLRLEGHSSRSIGSQALSLAFKL